MRNLNDKRQPGERVFTTLQLTRLFGLITENLRTLKRVGIATCIAMVLGVSVYAGVSYRYNQRLEAAVDRLEEEIAVRKADTFERRRDACERDNVAFAADRLDAQTTADGFESFAQQLIADIPRPLPKDIEEGLVRFRRDIVAPQLALADPVEGPNADRDCSDQALGITDEEEP